MNETRTVADLVALIDRTAKALHEVGETDLANNCHVRVQADGRIWLTFAEAPREEHPHPPVPGSGHLRGADAVKKAVALDPVFGAARR